MTKREAFLASLRAARFLVAVAMLGAVIAGALGYGDTVKILTAGSFAGLAVFLKATHFLA